MRKTAAMDVDVVVVGAGLSGIGAGYRLQTERPGTSYVILEARDRLGGTWDLFRYPGIRSDSDMFTLGYEFKPWRSPQALADGSTILSYIQETAREFRIEDKIRYRTKVVAADWSGRNQEWTLTLETGAGRRETITCGFLYACAGYYDYDEGYTPDFPGIEQYDGQVVHPQFWPEDLDYAGKRVVVIGSGATAVTLVPAMLEGEGAAAHVTMLQRSPTWIASLPGRDAFADWVRDHLPAKLAHRVIRTKNIGFNMAFYQFCRRRPERARRLLLKFARGALRDSGLVEEHFTPTYDPWDQRLCAIPDGDLWRALNKGSAEVVTGHIDTFLPEGIRLQDGHVLEADVVVTATGLKMKAFGGIVASVDGEPVSLNDQLTWRGAMITGIPNLAVCIGYTNASWTLRADLTHRLVCKLLEVMEERGWAVVVPEAGDDVEPQPLLNLSSGYIKRAESEFPHQGDRGPWRVHQNYLVDSLVTLRGDIAEGLHATRRREPALAAVTRSR